MVGRCKGGHRDRHGLAGTGLLMVAVDAGLDIYREERGVEPN